MTMNAGSYLPPQVWLRCITHDVKFLTRSLESQKHGRPECEVVNVEDDAS